jgi:hypothetical protein
VHRDKQRGEERAERSDVTPRRIYAKPRSGHSKRDVTVQLSWVSIYAERSKTQEAIVSYHAAHPVLLLLPTLREEKNEERHKKS